MKLKRSIVWNWESQAFRVELIVSARDQDLEPDFH
jgi:hypothetical protein